MRRRHGISTLYMVLSVLVLLMINGLSGWFVGVNLSREVAMAEAGRTIRLACDSGIEEAMEGFVRSVNLLESEITTPEERSAYAFGQALRKLGAGQVLKTRFVPTNTRRALAPLSVDVPDVEVRLFAQNTLDGPKTDVARCQKLLAVLQKWSKIPG